MTRILLPQFKPYISEDKPSIHDLIWHLRKPSCEFFIALASIKYVTQQMLLLAPNVPAQWKQLIFDCALARSVTSWMENYLLHFVRYSAVKAYSSIRYGWSITCCILLDKPQRKHMPTFVANLSLLGHGNCFVMKCSFERHPKHRRRT